MSNRMSKIRFSRAKFPISCYKETSSDATGIRNTAPITLGYTDYLLCADYTHRALSVSHHHVQNQYPQFWVLGIVAQSKSPGSHNIAVASLAVSKKTSLLQCNRYARIREAPMMGGKS